MKPYVALLCVTILTGCQAPPDTSTAAPVVTSPDELGRYVGQVITLRGVVTNTKIPTIIGVDVQSDEPDLRNQHAEATGTLIRWEVKPEEVSPWIAHRGPGVFYQLRDLKSNYSAQVRPVSR